MTPGSVVGEKPEALIRREVVDKYGKRALGVGWALKRKSGLEGVLALA